MLTSLTEIMASCIVLAVLRHTLVWGALPCSMSSPSLKVLVYFVMSNAAWNPLLSLVVYLYLPYYTLLAAGLKQLKVLPRHSALTLCVVRVFSRTADFFETSVPVCVGSWSVRLMVFAHRPCLLAYFLVRQAVCTLS